MHDEFWLRACLSVSFRTQVVATDIANVWHNNLNQCNLSRAVRLKLMSSPPATSIRISGSCRAFGATVILSFLKNLPLLSNLIVVFSSIYGEP